jgi:hypothetical protein
VSWEQLLSIQREAAQVERDQRERDPVACPNDGEPLSLGPDGKLFCRYDGRRPL